MRWGAVCAGLALLTVMAASMVAADQPGDSRIRTELQEILSRPEYNRTFGPNPVQRFWAKVWEWYSDFAAWFRRLFSFGGGTAGRIASIVFACLVIGAFVVLLVFVARRLSMLSRNTGADDDSVLESYELPSARPLVARARALAEAGDFRGAFRCAYLASISHLDETGALRFERSRTNWEYMRELDRGGHEAARDSLRPLTLDFDRRIYGREHCTRADYERALAAYGVISAPEVAA